tara:strand:+ start:251 stop:907 length:657 start_codon:yes stop_codon:yes gene_type:complete
MKDNYNKLDQFYDLYWKYNTENNSNEILDKLKELANETPELKGWPENKTKFWDVESFFWQLRFKKGEREFIRKLVFEYLSSNHLDVASGSLPINHKCTCIDISQEMLNSIKTDQTKIVSDLEEPLPFKENEFKSASCIFILNYIDNLDQLLKEIFRILNEDGELVVVLSNKPLAEFHKTKEKNSNDRILEKLEENNFYLTIQNEEFNGKELLIIIAKK